MVSKWLFGNIFWPTLQSAVGAGIVAAIFMGTNQATQLVSGCPAAVVTMIAEGEKALVEGDTKRALAILEDGLINAPKSACSNAFAAAAELQAMRELLAADDAANAEVYRSRCYRHASLASPIFGSSPRVDAIRRSCSAA